MEEIKDERSFDRQLSSKIPVLLLKNKWQYVIRYRFIHHIVMYILDKSYLYNISASGSCIFGNNDFKRGDLIRLILFTPDAGNLNIKGIVRWISRNNIDKESFIGIQFLAFGNQKKYNSYEILKQLHILTLQNMD
jgi:hypothetical protein